MYQQIIDNVKIEFDKALSFFEKEVGKVRTGQATPALIEDIMVNIAGQEMQLKQLAAISVPEKRQLSVQPWDASYLKPIEQALGKSDLGANPIVDQQLIRLTLPPMTEEFRQRMVKMLTERAEESKRTLRKLREDAWNDIQEQTRKGEIREDDKFKGKEDLQKLIDEYAEKIDGLVIRKEKELSPE